MALPSSPAGPRAPEPHEIPRDQFGSPVLDFSRLGSSWNESQSTSEPTYLQTPQNAIMDAISRVASGLAQQMLGWANDTYAQTSKITDQAVGNFFQISQQMSGLSNNLTDQYNDVFAPQNRSLALEADQYNSDARQEVNMGMAGATQAQAGDAALRASEEALRSYGINPADGRYAALDQAARVQNAANVAGAMNMERERTAQVGRDLRRDAVQVGAMLPAAIANTANVANQANTGASNANLANANTGKSLMQLPNDYLNTAMGIKMPISGQRSQSTSSGGSRSSGMGGGASGGGGGGRPSMGGGGGGGRMFMPSGGGAQGRAAWMPQHTGYQPNRGGPAYQQGASIRHLGPYQGASGAGFTDIDTNWMLDGVDFDQWTGSDDYYQAYENYGIGYDPSFYSSEPVEEYGGSYDNWGFDNYDFGSNGWDSNYGGGGDYGTYGNYDYGSDGSYDTGWGNIGYDYSANSYDPGWDYSYDTPVDTDWGTGASAFQDYGYNDWGGSSYDTTSYDSDYYAGDYDTSGEYVYAKGGPVPPGKHRMPDGKMMPNSQMRPPGGQGGGRVPPQMSPSGGRRVDDVPAMSPQGPARLNADEFVIPRDVAMWKGQEFFQKLIDQSRQKRVMAPAPGGQPAPQMR